MRAVRAVLGALAVASAVGLCAGKDKVLRQEKEKLFTREANELSAPTGADLAKMEDEAMEPFTNTRALANLGCQYATVNVVILDNSSAVFDKELWMFKLLIKEIAAAFLRVNQASEFGLILTTQPNIPLILPIGQNGQNIQNIWQTVKGIQRVDNGMVGNVAEATTTAIRVLAASSQILPRTENVILMTAPYTALLPQLASAAAALNQVEKIRRFAVATRMTQTVYHAALEAFAGCPGCGHVHYVGNCTPAKFLFLLKYLYPQLCMPPNYYREAAVVTFQVDGMGADDENLPEFVDKFLDLMSQTTGVSREYLEVIDVRDSTSPTGPQYNARRLKSIDNLVDLPHDTLLDVVVRDAPTGLRDTPFRIASRFDADLRNELSPVAELFNNEMSGVPKIRKISQPRDSIFARPTGGLTFQKLHLGNGFETALGDGAALGNILQH